MRRHPSVTRPQAKDRVFTWRDRLILTGCALALILLMLLAR